MTADAVIETQNAVILKQTETIQLLSRMVDTLLDADRLRKQRTDRAHEVLSQAETLPEGRRPLHLTSPGTKLSEREFLLLEVPRHKNYKDL
jgi:hypothetical protein